MVFIYISNDIDIASSTTFSWTRNRDYHTKYEGSLRSPESLFLFKRDCVPESGNIQNNEENPSFTNRKHIIGKTLRCSLSYISIKKYFTAQRIYIFISTKVVGYNINLRISEENSTSTYYEKLDSFNQ